MGRYLDQSPLGLGARRVGPHDRQRQGERRDRRPTSYLPPGPGVTHDVPPVPARPIDDLESSSYASLEDHHSPHEQLVIIPRARLAPSMSFNRASPTPSSTRSP